MFWLLCIPVIMGALALGAITISFQKLLFGAYQGTMLPIRSIIKYLIRVIFWLLGQLLRLEQKEKLDKVEIFFVHIFESCMQALDNTLRILLSVRASTKRLEIHPVLLITLVLLLGILSFRVGRNFEEDKQDDQKMQIQTEIAEKDARIEELKTELKVKEEDIAKLKKGNVSSAPNRQDTPIPASPTESYESIKDAQIEKQKEELQPKKADITKSTLEECSPPSIRHDTPIVGSPTQSHESLDVSKMASGKESMTTGIDKEGVKTRNRGNKKHT
jgi:hypothetical protein